MEKIQPGEVVRLGEVEGVFTLPEQVPPKMLFISAGSGITPIMSMLRSLDRRNELGDVVVIHSVSKREQCMFLSVLEDLDGRHEDMRLDLRLTSERGRMSPGDLDELCPDWREREAFCSGPGELLDALVEHWDDNGDADRLHFERFQPKISGDGAPVRVAKCPSSKARKPLNVTAAHQFWKPARRPVSTWRTAAESASAIPASGR